jgi:hypothetical protein
LFSLALLLRFQLQMKRICGSSSQQLLDEETILDFVSVSNADNSQLLPRNSVLRHSSCSSPNRKFVSR